jgi:mannose-6-phosphate isomerase-like protein (cupin superfamily)
MADPHDRLDAGTVARTFQSAQAGWKSCPHLPVRAGRLPACPTTFRSAWPPKVLLANNEMTIKPQVKNYRIAQLDQIDPIACPCGWARRAFGAAESGVATVHLVDIQSDARAHYHKRLTEIYIILEGEGCLELDGAQVPVKPLTTVMIHPGCRHRAIGSLRILNIPIPAFDPDDEWFD